MLHISRCVVTIQVQCDHAHASSSFQSRVISQNLLATSDDVIWPQMTSMKVTDQNLHLDPQQQPNITQFMIK